MRFKSSFDQFTKKVEKSINEQLSEEVEEIQLQVNSLRAQLKQKDKKRQELLEHQENMQQNINPSTIHGELERMNFLLEEHAEKLE